MKDKTQENELILTKPVIERQSKIIIPNQGVIQEQLVICKVCGHSNPSTNGICEMCSNYLY